MNPILDAVTSVLGAVARVVTVLALTIFMLVFGGGLARRLLAVAPAVDRPRWEHVLAKAYSAVGGYLGGILFICSINATLTAAILDRLAMHAIRIDIDGPSYRQHVAQTRTADRPAQR